MSKTDTDNMNPYMVAVDRMTDEILQKNVAAIKSEAMGVAHINADNDWILPGLAGWALLLSFAWSAPQSAAYHRDDVWEQMQRLVRRLLDSCRNGKWWRDLPGTGDDNINRFTLLPLMDLYLRVGPRLDPELKKQCLAVIEQAAAVQVETYHNPVTRCRGEYPNMDAYFMVIMEEAARILNRAQYHSLALEYLGYLESSRFPGGGFVYYKGTNECESYHQLNIMMLTRLYELTGAGRILDLLRRTLPYYPNVIEPAGVVEYYTDPFWKHYWIPAGPLAPDVLATLFPDAPEAGEHRYLANVLRSHAQKFTALYLVWGVEYWQPEAGQKPRDAWVRYDASIRGPRGRCGSFSWGGTTGRCPDTLVGAMVAQAPDRVSALEAVGAEVILAAPPVKEPGTLFYGRRHGTSAYVSGHHYLRRMVVGDNWACLAAWSPLYAGGIGWNELLPDSGWQMHQVWWLGAERMIGAVVVEAAHAGRDAAAALGIYARLGGSQRDIIEKNGLYTRGELNLRLVRHNLEQCELQPGYRFYLDAEPTSTELRLTLPVPGADVPVAIAVMEIYPAAGRPADINPLPAGQGTGFTVSASGVETVVVFNASRVPVRCAALGLQGFDGVYRTSSGFPGTQAGQAPCSTSVMPGELVTTSGAAV